MPHFRTDVRLVRAERRHESGLLRGTTTLWMPHAAAEWLWENGPEALGTDVSLFLQAHRFTSDKKPNRAESRNGNFLDAICDTSAGELEQALENTTFVIWGCGGLGTSTAIQLASLGATSFLLVDGDRLEDSNLNRMPWFADDDVGRLKVDVLHNFLTRRFSAKVSRIDHYSGPETVHEAVSRLEGESAFLCLLLDNRDDTREIISTLGPARSMPYIHAGYAGPYCVVGPAVLDPGDPCPFCLSDDFEIVDDQGFVAPSASPNNLLIAAFLVAQVMRVLAEAPSAIRSRRWSLDLRSGDVTWDDLAGASGCRWCR